jgi:DNA (cytosine-5)-methyltransferase 1
MTIPDSLSVKEASISLGVSEQRVRTLLRSGALPGKQVGKSWIVDPADVEAFKKNGAAAPPEDHPRKPGPLPKLKALSFFSGAMGLDLGLEQAGIHMLSACEMDKACRRTITANRPDIALLGDVWQYSANDIRKAAGLGPKDEVDVMVGGPPCQAFSTAGARRGFKDERGNVFLRYVELILELRPRYAVIENVRGLLSAPMSHRPHAERGEDWEPDPEEKPGGALLHILKMLRDGGYGVSFNLYNAANYGVPQVRERVVLICARDGSKVPHLAPTHAQDGSHGLRKWHTLREAVADVRGCDHVDFPEDRLRYYRLLGPGQYWKHLPEDLQKQALGKSYFAGGGKTGFLRRLGWDKPSCTLVTSPAMPATDICHPVEDRPLSVQEYKALQMFPADWVVCGSLTDQYRQIGNAVPVGLGEAVGRAILAHMKGKPQKAPEGFAFSRYKENDEVTWEAKTRKALGLAHDEPKKKPAKAARKPKAPGVESRQIPLFDAA